MTDKESKNTDYRLFSETTVAKLSDSERERLYKAEMLLNVSKEIAARETLDDVLTYLMHMTAKELNAERCTIFLNDSETDELYARVAMGNFNHQIRILNTQGIAGLVFTKGEGMIIHDAYADNHFKQEIDAQTGFVTKSILCTPIRTVKGEIIGVTQALNKLEGRFNEQDMEVLEAISMQAAIAFQGGQQMEKMKISRKEELGFLDIVADVTSEIDLGALLHKVMGAATKMLHAERSTLFLNDEKTNELWSEVGDGISNKKICIPNHTGIAGAVFTSGETINIPYAYADLRFNPAVDKQTGFFTRSILCVPVVNKNGRVIGVTQVLNKKGGPFTGEDESRLRAFTAQISIALENAKLFNDVQNMKNYNESMLESMSNGVITLDGEKKIITCNAAALRILHTDMQDIINTYATEFFTTPNDWIITKIEQMENTGTPELTMDAVLAFKDHNISVNITVLPLISTDDNKLGSMIMIEDISSEKRMKSTMSRYIDPCLVDQIMDKSAQNILGGRSTIATVLFSDIRGFTTLTESKGAQGTVSLLNEYFTIMVDCIQKKNGMLDKFIGDAIMAGFGIPIPGDNDEDNAVRAAISMIQELDRWNLQRHKAGEPLVDMGIGLNTDTVVSGNIGSPKRMDFTMIGDGVNIAARLESACKQYGARILISENTHKKLKGAYRVRDVDDVLVKGKTKPVRIFEVLDYHTSETFPNLSEVVSHFREGRTHYREGTWNKAIRSFTRASELNPHDCLSQMFIKRCNHMLDNPSDKKWDGIWIMTSK
ncbi:MAG: GAF domain-containing protein [Desulfotignum sp.]|nr:GAF domain-containing protein [Desulfotignum sp.]